MKIEIDDSVLIEAIVKKVIDHITPLLTAPNLSNNDEIMNVEGLASYLKVTKSWVYEKIHKKEIPFYKAGKFPRFRKKDIDLWLKNPYFNGLNTNRPYLERSAKSHEKN